MSNLNAGTGLTTLPLEIKQKIFELVLFDNPRPLERLSILRVSRAIGAEAADVFYNEETFAFCLDFKSIRRYPVPPVGVIRRTQNVVFTVSGMWEGFKRMTPWAAFYGKSSVKDSCRS